MFHFSHSSFPSSEDKRGFRQSLSIDFLKKTRTDHYVYKGRARSSEGLSDPRDGAIVLAMFSKNQRSDDWVNNQVLITKMAQDTAEKFNNVVSHFENIKPSGVNGDRNIEFLCLQTSELDSVSFLDRKRKKNEKFIMMDQLCRCEVFVRSDQGSMKSQANKNGIKKLFRFFSATTTHNLHKKRHRSCSEGDLWMVQDDGQVYRRRAHEHLHAFVHYFCCQHNWKIAIDFLEGEYDEKKGYMLAVPVFHSHDRRFGERDKGTDGIFQVFRNHPCNPLCSHFTKMPMGVESVQRRMSAKSLSSCPPEHCLPLPSEMTDGRCHHYQNVHYNQIGPHTGGNIYPSIDNLLIEIEPYNKDNKYNNDNSNLWFHSSPSVQPQQPHHLMRQQR